MLTKAGRKLQAIVRRSGLGVTGFAAKAGVDRVTLYRVMHGERYEHIGVDFALNVIAASNGAEGLCIEDFSFLTAVPYSKPAKRTGTDG